MSSCSQKKGFFLAYLTGTQSFSQLLTFKHTTTHQWLTFPTAGLTYWGQLGVQLRIKPPTPWLVDGCSTSRTTADPKLSNFVLFIYTPHRPCLHLVLSSISGDHHLYSYMLLWGVQQTTCIQNVELLRHFHHENWAHMLRYILINHQQLTSFLWAHSSVMYIIYIKSLQVCCQRFTIPLQT